jgi:arginase
MSKKIALVINESEISAGTRGASLGPGAMRVVDHASEQFIFGKYPNYFIPDCNHLLDQPTDLKWGKRADGLAEVYQNTADIISERRKADDFVFVIAADHGSAGGTIAGLKIAHPQNRIGVLWIDAHGDMHTPYTSPSGNMHGMPLATALNDDNLECQKNEVSEKTQHYWNVMKNIGGIAPKIQAEDLAFIALRDLEPEEIALMQRKNLQNIAVEELRKLGVEKVNEHLLAKFAQCDEIYVSFDVDSMDPDLVSYGTGTPVKNGLTPEEAKDLLVFFAAQEKVKCIEFVEVNPCLDNKKNKMAETAYDLFKAVLSAVENR